jgi:hypothetical protein
MMSDIRVALFFAFDLPYKFFCVGTGSNIAMDVPYKRYHTTCFVFCLLITNVSLRRSLDFTALNLGHVKSADLTWEYALHPLNPLTWRLQSESQLFVNRIEIETMGHGKKHTFCAEDTPFVTGKATNVVWKPTCRENSKDPGNSFLGTVLNADPIGNAKFVIDQVSKK